MAERRFDIVLYGASGFTGAYVLEEFVKYDEFGKIRFAVAGRNEQRLNKVIKKVAELTGKDLNSLDVIIADSSRPESLDEMAKQTKVIINVVGPYRLYGEAVVKAAVENGTSHIDISGEPAFLERMQLTYHEKAKETGAYVVGACGWDSIPCDLGINFLKNNFNGTLAYAETFAQIKRGEDGYVFNDGTYQTLILGLENAKTDNLGGIRRQLMTQKLEKPKYRPPKRPAVWGVPEIGAAAVPFLGADKSVVQRSQYYDSTVNGRPAVPIETYFAAQNTFWAYMGILWMTLFSYVVKFDFTRKLAQQYPYIFSCGMFSPQGPSREQCKQATFTYWFMGSGWSATSSQDEKPSKTVIARCDGPDSGYIGTAGCILSAAFTVLKDKDSMPDNGGCYTTTSAFTNTSIYDRLASFGLTFRIHE
ncbi:unnamed protein product [Bursaphelenchus okinawaensis]|uniref:Saccharopine dehydrogenase NADP binding domain-containing protein n=1 Tax=Bursaphelenchus okinawaensis TaxID=465554 RepID=A0A811K7J6_9BILA|nr:unnamed protein product [Bursaphelenchus okinawaensis]CAG9094123.1 unnamed protein product [Bursaphelenchus okinawaensis]